MKGLLGVALVGLREIVVLGKCRVVKLLIISGGYWLVGRSQ